MGAIETYSCADFGSVARNSWLRGFIGTSGVAICAMSLRPWFDIPIQAILGRSLGNVFPFPGITLEGTMLKAAIAVPVVPMNFRLENCF